MESDHEDIQVKLEYPVAVEAILSVSFNLEGFKMIFDFILEVLRRHEQNFRGQVPNRNDSGGPEIAEILKALKSTQETVNLLQERQGISESKTQSLENSQAKTEISLANLGEFQKNSEKFQENCEKFQESTEKFQESTEKFQENCENVQKSLLERVESLESTQSSHQSKIDLHDTSIKDLISKTDNFDLELAKTSRILEAFRQDLDKITEDMEKTEKTLTEVKEKSNQHSGRLIDHEKRLHRLESEIQQVLNAVKNLGGEIEEISKPVEQVTSENTYVDSGRIEELSDSLKYVLKNMNDFEARVRGCEENSSKAKQASDRAEMISKTTETELKRIEELIRKFETGSPSKKGDDKQEFSSSSMNSVQKSLKDLENLINSKMSAEDMQKLLKDLLARLDDHNNRIGLLESSILKKAFKSDLDEMFKLLNSKQAARVEENIDSSKLTGISRRLGLIEDTLRHLALPEGYDLIIIVNLLVKVQQDHKETRDKLEKFMKDLWLRLKDFEEQLSKKATIDQLKALEGFMATKLKELFEECLKKFADKNETKKAFKYMEKLMKETETVKTVREGDDAMLARKPLGGWSCASCQKHLEKLMGKIGPYQQWNKMPYRDPADRIARAGPGFSRMLATVQTEQFSSRNKHSVFHQNSPPYAGIEEEISEGTLPTVKKQVDRPFTSL